MKETQKGEPKESGTEKISRIYRNWNVLGAVALGSLAAVIPGPNVLIGTLAGLNVVQAGAGEIAYRAARKSRRTSS